MASTAQLRASYPEFIKRWPTSTRDPVCSWATAATVTFLAGGPDYPGGRVNLKVHPATRQIWRAQAAVMLHFGYTFREKHGGTVSCRRITGGNNTTLHAHGIAKDDNPSSNGYRKARGALDEPDTGHKEGLLQWGRYTDMPPKMVRAIEAIRLTNGARPFEWGGRWWNIKDPMHWELDVLQTGLAPVNLASLPPGAWTAYLAFEAGEQGEGVEVLYGLDIGKLGDDSLPDAPAHRVLQAFLVRAGQNIGAWGPNEDGVDGRPGDDTRSGLVKWKIANGVTAALSAGEGKIGDYEMAAIYGSGGGGGVDRTARSAAASAATQAAAARGRADTALDAAQRANKTLDKIRSE